MSGFDKVSEGVTTHIMDESGDGQRLDNFLFKVLKGVPKSHIYQLIRKSNIRVNKKRIKAHYKLNLGDELRLPPIRVAQTKSEFVPIFQVDRIKSCILFEDDGLMVINKPSGIPVHGGTDESHGVIDLLKKAFPQYRSLELAHRLDKETSGCLIIAKKRSVLRLLHGLFREGKVEKTYLALTKGFWKPDPMRVTLPLVKNQLQSGERMVHVDRGGKTAISTFKMLQKFEDASLVEVKIETGRTHQIRVHAAHSRHPIAGDSKYGDDEFNLRFKKIGLKHLFLHAAQLVFQLPTYDKPLVIQTPLPEDLLGVLEKISNIY